MPRASSCGTSPPRPSAARSTRRWTPGLEDRRDPARAGRRNHPAGAAQAAGRFRESPPRGPAVFREPLRGDCPRPRPAGPRAQRGTGADRRLFLPRVFLRGGGADEPQHRAPPRPVGPRPRRAALPDVAQGGWRGAHLVHHLPAGRFDAGRHHAPAPGIAAVGGGHARAGRGWPRMAAPRRGPANRGNRAVPRHPGPARRAGRPAAGRVRRRQRPLLLRHLHRLERPGHRVRTSAYP